MDICLGNRTAETVAIYFERAGEPEIKAVLPQKAKTLEEALADYELTRLPNANSYGRTIIANGNYIGDIWCYCIDLNQEPNAMLSYCIFEKVYWSQGIATKAAAMFLKEVQDRYNLSTIGAFTYSDNIASISVLKKNGFVAKEVFSEDGRESKFFQYTYRQI